VPLGVGDTGTMRMEMSLAGA